MIEQVLEKTACTLCRRPAPAYSDASDTSHFECDRCGRFAITWELILDSIGIPDDFRPFLSAATRQASDRGKPVALTTDNWQTLGASHAGTSVSQKIERVLSLIASKCGTPGEIRTIKPDTDFPVADCVRPSEMQEYLTYLVDQGLIRQFANETGQPVDIYTPTIKGWQTIEPTLSVVAANLGVAS